MHSHPKYHFITVGRNVEPWIQGSLFSAVGQTGHDFDVCVVDDVSDDDSAGIGKEICDAYGWAHIANKERKGCLYNQVMAVDELAPKPEDVCIILDADDQLAHDGVLKRLDAEYKSAAIGVTFGSYASVPFSPTCIPATPFPEIVKTNYSYRRYVSKGRGLCWNHLRTFRYGAFSQIDRDLRFKWSNGEWFSRGADYAVMFPLLEGTGRNHRFIPDVLYHYNSENPNSEWRVAPSDIDKIVHRVLNVLPTQERFDPWW